MRVCACRDAYLCTFFASAAALQLLSSRKIDIFYSKEKYKIKSLWILHFI